MKINHVGYAVKDMDASIRLFQKMGYEVVKKGIDDIRHVKVAVAEMGAVKVELLSPVDNIKSPIDNYLSKIGSTPYHICYEVDDMERCVQELQDIGFTLVSRPDVSLPLKGTICFMYSEIIGLCELIKY